MKKALMIGSTVADVLIRVDHLPSLEEDVNPYGQTVALGGCCYNVSNMLSVFSVPYTLFTPVGTGIYGTFILNALEKKGIEPVLRSEAENGCCYCIIDKDGNRTFMAVHGTEYRFQKEWFDELDVREYTDVYVCGLELEEETGVFIVDFLKRNPQLKIWFAPSSRILYVPEDRMNAVLDCHPILHLNKREANEWMLKAGLIKKEFSDVKFLCRTLYCRTGNTVIITDGERGAWAFDGFRDHYSAAVRVNAVDGTGAGDSHLGTVMAMTLKGKKLDAALRTASFISSRVVSRPGGVLVLDE